MNYPPYCVKRGNGANIVFLHGWQQDKATWSRVIDFLERDFTCWAIDLPGFGANPRPPAIWTPMDYGDWVKDVLMELGVTSYFLVSHSFGGRVAICLSATGVLKPEKLILYAVPGVQVGSPFVTRVLVFIYKALRLNRTARLKDTSLFRMIQAKLQSSDYRDAKELRDIFLASIQYNLKPLLEKINVPTLILHGEMDEVVPLETARMMRVLIKDSQLKTVPGGSHFLHMENPLLFSGYIRSFLNT